MKVKKDGEYMPFRGSMADRAKVFATMSACLYGCPVLGPVAIFSFFKSHVFVLEKTRGKTALRIVGVKIFKREEERAVTSGRDDK